MYRKILLTLDGSVLARAAIVQATMLAAGTDAEVDVLQVIDPPSALALQSLGDDEQVGESQQTAAELGRDTHFMRRQVALEEVAAAKQQLEANDVRTVHTTVLDGLAGNEIVDYATHQGAEAIVMATRGHGGLGREVAGSVAEYVLRHAGNSAVILVGPRSVARLTDSRILAGATAS